MHSCYEPDPRDFDEPSDYYFGVTCKYCGKKDYLKWFQINNKWVILDLITKKKHDCKH